MLHLNLLSVTKRTKLEQLVKFLFTKNILEIVLLFSTLVGLALALAWLTLVDQSNTTSQGAVTNTEYLAYNNDVKEINRLIRSTALASTGYTTTTPKLLGLIEQIPGDIKLSSLNFDRRANTLTLSGTAKTRSALLRLQEVLRAIPWIEKSSAPTSQLFTATDVVFEIKSTLQGFPPLRPDAPTTPKQPTKIE